MKPMYKTDFIGSKDASNQTKARTNWLFAQNLLTFDLNKKQLKWKFSQVRAIRMGMFGNN